MRQLYYITPIDRVHIKIRPNFLDKEKGLFGAKLLGPYPWVDGDIILLTKDRLGAGGDDTWGVKEE